MEKSESGAPIYRYNESEKNEFKIASEDSSIEEISNHIEKYVGEIEMVFHEIGSNQVHIDVLWVKANSERPYHTLITSGMSDLPMSQPKGVEGEEYAELTFCLPADWKLSEESFNEEANYWPIRWLLFLARFPHEYNTWLSFGHTIPNGDPAKPLTYGTKLNTIALLPSVILDEGFKELKLNNKTIKFYSLVPLYSEEVNLKMRKGIESLFDGFDKHGVTDLLDINRPNTAKKIFGLF
ncbi:suppressor of fused domain protein [Flagellimonas baculiformis]|uniref:suppressor of fused domain protein n=1 Tax=Flagellimonas baculiformis TaxID=3067310 RepID=UPI00296FDC6C|nr:suppressor of fused domain protein [Muricauda sp. D6]